MTLTKFADVEMAEVLSPEEHERIEGELNRLGVKSASELTASQRTALNPRGPMRTTFKGIVDRPTARRLGSS